jgi:hypothetical protein
MAQILNHPFLQIQSHPDVEAMAGNREFLDTVVPHLECLDFQGEHRELLMSAFNPTYVSNLVQRTKEPALLTASRMLDELAVLVLLHCGQSATMEVNGSGNTALHLACLANEQEMREHMRMHNGTPFEVLRERVVCTLIGAGASFGTTNNLQLTPLDIAQQMQPHCIECLSRAPEVSEASRDEWIESWERWRQECWMPAMQIEEQEVSALQVCIFVQAAHDTQDAVMLVPTPKALDIHAQYQEDKDQAEGSLNMIIAKSQLAGSDAVKAYQDATFPPASCSIWCDEGRPPRDDWITHPSAWSRPGEIYASCHIRIATSEEPGMSYAAL